MLALVQRVEEAVARATRTSYFREWVAANPVQPGDRIILNNSFLSRESLKTAKSAKYLAVELAGYPPEVKTIWVATAGISVSTSPFKVVSPKSKNIAFTPLEDAIQDEVTRFGELAFILIGTADDSAKNEVSLADKRFTRLIWDQGFDGVVEITLEAGAIRVGHISNESAIWTALVAAASELGIQLDEEFRDTLCQALTLVQSEAVAAVTLPEQPGGAAEGLTASIADALDEHVSLYRTAVQSLTVNPDDHGAQTEVFRLSYTFASDALKYLELLMSVGDLKPLVMWMSMHSHLELVQAFNALPWGETARKPSIKNYREAIADARNSAFHNALPFRNSLSIELPEGAIRRAKLTLFGPHKSNTNQLVYEDKELVDVLTQFTRARERQLPLTFWVANMEVLGAVVALFRASSKALRDIHASIAANHSRMPRAGHAA